MIDFEKYKGFTPGNWENDNGNIKSGRRLVANSNGHQSNVDFDAVMLENKANGDLIADAPLILEHARKLQAMLVKHQFTWDNGYITCLECGGLKPRHNDNCSLAAILPKEVE